MITTANSVILRYMAATDFPLCKICVPPRRHAMIDGHKYDESQPPKSQAVIAQSVERQSSKLNVVGSTPSDRSKPSRKLKQAKAVVSAGKTETSPPAPLKTEMVPISKAQKLTQAEKLARAAALAEARESDRAVSHPEKLERRRAQIRAAVAKCRAKKRAEAAA